MFNDKEEEGYLGSYSELKRALELAADLRASYEELLGFIRRNSVGSYVSGQSVDGGDIESYYSTNARFSFRKKDYALIKREQIESEISTSVTKGTPRFSRLSEFRLTPYGHQQDDENSLIWML